MKTIVLIFAALLVSGRLLAQDCASSPYFQKGRVIESTMYNSANKPIHSVTATVTDVTNSGGTVIAKIVEDPGSSLKMAKKKYITFKCSGGALSINISSTDDSQASSGDLKSSYMLYPSSMSTGDHLPDHTDNTTITQGSKTFHATSVTTNRVVAAQETVTTSAGSWKCYKINYKVTVTMDMKLPGGATMPPQVEEATDWYAPGFGIVKYQTSGMTVEITKIK